jgi:hypothetical protein
MNRRCWTLSAAMGVAALVFDASPALAQSYLGGDLRPFAVLAGTPNVTCTGASLITGDIGISPAAAIIGFPAPCTNVGTLHAADAQAAAAQANLTTAYTTLASLPCNFTLGPDLGGRTLVPGVYCVSAAASNLTGVLTLDAQGNGNASWVFRMSSTLITSPNSVVTTINGGNPCGVQWQVSSSATIDTNTTFLGNILALTSITMNTGARLVGRALARNGAVTLDTNNISFALCGAGAGDAPPPPFGSGGVPALPDGMEWALLVILVGIGAYIVSRR